MKRVLSILLCAIFVMMVVFSGCAKTENNNGTSETKEKVETSGTEETESSIVTKPGTFPVVKDKVTLKVLVAQSPFVQDINTNEFTQYYEDKTNVHIEWDVLSADLTGDAKTQKINVLLASGSYPDVFMLNPNAGAGALINRSIQVVYGEQGVFLPLNNLIDKYTIHIKKMLAEDKYIKQSATTPNGNIYGLPSMSYVYHLTAPNKMWVYEPWLKKLGIKEPETTEEFYQMLKAFKERDPNGNGKADEIPLAAIGTRLNWGVIPFLMSAFTYYSDFTSSSKNYIQENGKVEFVPSKLEFKEGLKFIRKLYTEGLLVKDFITMDSKQITALGENPDTPVLGAAPSLWWGSFTINEGPSGRFKDYTAIAPLKGPKGLRIAPVGLFPSADASAFNITKDCKYPEVAIRWIDWFFSFEGGLTGMYGLEGKGWRRGNEGEKSISGGPALFATLGDYGKIQNTHWSNMAQFYEPEKQRLGIVATEIESRLYNLTHDKYEMFKISKNIPDMYMTEKQSTDLAELDVLINKSVEQWIAQFITGAKDLDKDWDSFVNELDRLGLKRSLEIRQEVYDANIKNNK